MTAERFQPTMTGYEVAEAIDAGHLTFVLYGSGDDATWYPANDTTDDHPSGTPSGWWRENVGQIVVAAYSTINHGAPQPEATS